MTSLSRTSLALCMALFATGTEAQTLPYGSAIDGPSDSGPSDSGTSRGGAPDHRVSFSPYVEASQVVTGQISPRDDVLTWSTLAAGVDAGFNGRNNQGSVSVRYERRFGWGQAGDGDTVSGLARVTTAIVPRALTFEAGAMAARSRVEGNGSAVIAPLAFDDAVTQTYAVYAGPSLATRVGDVAVNGHYRAGYSRVESPGGLVTAPGQDRVDVFDDSVVHNAGIHAGTRAGEGLPVGVGVGANFYQEDVSNLDQRVRDMNARADVTVPLTGSLAAVGGIGYEKVRVSGRDAVRDAAGNAVIGTGGRYVTDKTTPRVIAFDTEGLIWDAGVVWRPSRRTAFEAHVGRRYGSTSYYGSLGWAPDSRSSVNVAVYDNVAGFGGQVTSALAALPTDFDTVRNPLTGDVTGCVVSLDKGNCLSGVLGSVRSSAFRARGIGASYSRRLGGLSAGISGGYDRRRYIAAPGTVLAAANGVVDENWWLAANVSTRIDRQSTFTANAYANWFQSGFALAGDGTAVGATASYDRALTDHLSATAALGIDGVSRETLDDIWNASALVGVRYRF